MAAMRRAAALVAVACAALLLAACGATSSPPARTPRIAGNQHASLGWVESTGSARSRLVFRVRSFSVTQGSWSADVSVTNDTAATFGIDGLSNPVGNTFGVMLFRTG